MEKSREELIQEVKNLTEGIHICMDTLRIISCPMRPDGTYNNDRESCRKMSIKAINKTEEIIYRSQYEINTPGNTQNYRDIPSGRQHQEFHHTEY
jgi:hypothetical protein